VEERKEEENGGVEMMNLKGGQQEGVYDA